MKLINLIIGAIALISSTAAAPASYSTERCGPDFNNAICDPGYCCSKYGWCGKSDDHCQVSKGCQSKFGECKTRDRCGPKFDNAVCDSGECCSEYGWCGKSDDHCLISNGCQSKYGKCIGASTTTSSAVKKTTTTKPSPSPTGQTKIKWAGFRYSPYGPKKSLDYTPEPAEWMKYIKKFRSHFESGTQGAVLLIVGHEHDEKYCEFLFPKPSGVSYSTSNVQFEKKDKYEEFLNQCDSNGIKVWLQVEPGSNDLVDLANITLGRYKHHPSVIGFGVDLEWWYRVDSSSGKKISDSEAKRVVQAVRKHNSDYTVFVKHWKPSYMPPSYRDHLVFVDDSQDFHGDKDRMIREFTEWAETFKGYPVMYQVGYEKDRKIWEGREISIAQAVANAAASVNNQVGIFWVDFTMKDAINK